jgi:hypothetical protein
METVRADPRQWSSAVFSGDGEVKPKSWLAEAFLEVDNWGGRALDGGAHDRRAQRQDKRVIHEWQGLTPEEATELVHQRDPRRSPVGMLLC